MIFTVLATAPVKVRALLAPVASTFNVAALEPALTVLVTAAPAAV